MINNKVVPYGGGLTPTRNYSQHPPLPSHQGMVGPDALLTSASVLCLLSLHMAWEAPQGAAAIGQGRVHV